MTITEHFEQLSLHNKLLALFLIAVSLITTFYLCVQKPHNLALEVAANQLAKKRATLEAIRYEVAGHADFGQRQAELQALLEKKLKLLPETENVSELLITLNKLGKEQQVTINAIKRLPAVDKQTYYEIPLEISLVSTYQDLLLYINELEQLTRFNTISQIAVQPDNKLLNVKLSASVYVYGPLPKSIQDGKSNK